MGAHLAFSLRGALVGCLMGERGCAPLFFLGKTISQNKKNQMKTIKQTLVILLGLLIGANFSVRAQSARHYTPGTNSPFAGLLQNPGLTNLPGAIFTIAHVLATTPAPMSVPVLDLTNHSESGTFWTMRSAVPLPGNFYRDLPVYVLDATNRIFLIDDRSVDYAALRARQEAEAATNGLDNPVLLSGLQLLDTNLLWLEVPTNALPGSNQFNVVIHQTVTGNYYDVLTKADLLLPTWGVERTVTGGGGNQTSVTLHQYGRTNLFVWAREAIIPIYQPPLSQTVFNGDTVTFTVGAIGSGLTYQWTFNGTNIPGATGSSYTVHGVHYYHVGDYACIVTGAAGSETTVTAKLKLFGNGNLFSTEMVVVGQRQDYTFRTGFSYYIPWPVQLYGRTVIESGAIIKFARYHPFEQNFIYGSLQVFGNLECQTTAYAPAILTTITDNAFGAIWGNGTPPYPLPSSTPYLDLTLAGNVSISGLHFRYANMAVSTPYRGRLDIWNCQFFGCNAAVINEFGGVDSFHNVLLADCYDGIAAYTNTYAIEMEHVTAEVVNLWDGQIPAARAGLTNCILLGDLGTANAIHVKNLADNPSPTNFQTCNAGIYYLAADSALHHIGSTNISPRLRSDLTGRTTYPPINIPTLTTWSGNLVLSPQVQRYAASAPDLGYHYAALDYTVANLIVFGSVNVLPGTAIGVRAEASKFAGNYWMYFGFDLREGSAFTSHGLPARMNVVADVQLVQEQYQRPATALFVPDYHPDGVSKVPPAMDFRFNDLYSAVNWYQVWAGYDEYYDAEASPVSLVNLQMADCQFHAGGLCLGYPDDGMLGNQLPWGYAYDNFYGACAVSLRNNLFDRANVNLQPSFYFYVGATNIDLRLSVANNLFQQNWFLLASTPATAGDWQLKDNVFDRVEFGQQNVDQQGAPLPLDLDYNAYRLLEPGAVYWGADTNRLTPGAGGGGHELVLNYPLYYTNGPFGSYYLDTVTPLWRAGSRTAAEAELSQYTTFVNQFKDASNQPVNIGLHYVATTNSQLSTINSQPLDSDGDGVPDYVEAEHGTDPNNNMTDGVTPDALNVAYDDVDLSGNGLVGRIKKALGLNFLTTTNPFTLKQVVMGGEPDVTTFKISIPYGSLTDIGTVHLLVNGVPATFDNVAPASDGNTLLVWSSVYEPARQQYQMQAQFVLSGVGNDRSILSGTGKLLPFYYNNNLQFFQSDSWFDDNGANLDAQLPVPNADYTINIYDPSANSATLVYSITNSTTNGMIQESWNATYGDNATPFTGESVNVSYDVTLLDPNTGNSITQTNHVRPMLRLNITEKFGEHDGFDFTYMYTPSNDAMRHEFDDNHHGNNGVVWQGLQSAVDNLLSPQTLGNGGSPYFYTSGFNHYTSEGNNDHGNGTSQGFPGYLGSMFDITNQNNGLFKDMTNGLTRSFYCYAHGNDGIMANYAPTNQKPSVSITANQIGNYVLHNVTVNGNPTNGVAGRLIALNPYRFVFMDGCLTASGWQWRSAFGIYPRYAAAKTRLGYQAYVGWAGSYIGWFNFDDDSDESRDIAAAYATTLNRFYDDWMRQIPLAQCIANASRINISNHAPFPVPQVGKNVTISGASRFGNNYSYTITNVETSKIYIIGHPGLTRSGLNKGVDDNNKDYEAPLPIQ